MMPYIIEAGQAITSDDGRDEFLGWQGKPTQRAVATLDEARPIIRDHVIAAGIAHGTTADPVGPAGGTVGPLPDGTVIEVAWAEWWELCDATDPTIWPERDGDPTPEQKQQIINAYNRKQEQK